MGARLGARAVIVGKVGDDEHGQAYAENLRLQNVDITHLGVEKVSCDLVTTLSEDMLEQGMFLGNLYRDSHDIC